MPGTPIKSDIISRYTPKHEHKWDVRGDGAIDVHIYCEQGLVEVFTYKGDARTEPFTRLTMWIYPHVYHANLAKNYGERWLRRLASEFAWECGKLAEASK